MEEDDLTELPDQDTTWFLWLGIAVGVTWLSLVLLIVRFVWMVGASGREGGPLRHSLSERMIMFGVIMMVLCIVQIMAGILDGWDLSSLILFSNCFFPTLFALLAFFGYFTQVFYFDDGSPILYSGSFAPPPSKNSLSTLLRFWAFGTCLSPLVFLVGLPYWQIEVYPTWLAMVFFLYWLVNVFGMTLLHACVAQSALKWYVIEAKRQSQQQQLQQPQQQQQKQQLGTLQRRHHVTVLIECVAERYYYEKVYRAFKGSIPPKRKRPTNSQRSDPNRYHVTNRSYDRVVMVTPELWVELTVEDPDAFLTAVHQALYQAAQHYVPLEATTEDDDDDHAAVIKVASTDPWATVVYDSQQQSNNSDVSQDATIGTAFPMATTIEPYSEYVQLNK